VGKILPISRGRRREGWEVAQTIHTHESKCKNDKIKERKNGINCPYFHGIYVCICVCPYT
jgi:hypothetical protein